MGRNKTKAVKDIAKMYEQLGLVQNDMFHKTIGEHLTRCDMAHTKMSFSLTRNTASSGRSSQEIIRCGWNGSLSIWLPPAGATKITLPQSGAGQREKSRSITRQTTHLRKETAYERHGA